MRLFLSYKLPINQFKMKTKLVLCLLLLFSIISCSKNKGFSPEFMEQTTGRYLYNANDVMDVYYENDKIFLSWRGANKIEPVVLDNNVIFLSELYSKLHFVQHPETKTWYLSKISKEDENEITYDYMKVDDTYKTPGMYLEEKNYEKAVEGFLAIKEKDSTSALLNERDFNSLGYRLMRDKDYEEAIRVFEMNVALYPESSNVYDSLGEAYLANGDSIQALNNYKKSFEINPNNVRAERVINTLVEQLN